MYEAIKVEDDYISELSDQKALEYYEEQFQRPQEIDGERNGSHTSVQERSGAKEKGRSPEAKEIDKYFIRYLLFTNVKLMFNKCNIDLKQNNIIFYF
mgnify:CR=1 FL=1